MVHTVAFIFLFSEQNPSWNIWVSTAALIWVFKTYLNGLLVIILQIIVLINMLPFTYIIDNHISQYYMSRAVGCFVYNEDKWNSGYLILVEEEDI